MKTWGVRSLWLGMLGKIGISKDRLDVQGVRLGGRMAGLSLVKQVVVLSIWPLLEQILTFGVGLTDLLISGRMTEGLDRVAVLDAMGLGGYVGWFFNIFQAAVATGVMALVSRATGARDRTLAHEGLHQGIFLGLGAGLLTWVILRCGVGYLVQWVGLSGSAAVYARQYVDILEISGPMSGMLLAINAALRGAGDTRTPFLAMGVVNIVNAAVSWLLVFAPAPIGGRGVVGIAQGTVVGWVVGLLVLLVMVRLQKRVDLTLDWSLLRLRLQTMRRILKVGVPQAMEITGMWLIHIFGIRVIAGLGDSGALGAHILAIRIESMSFLPGFAIATACAALVGQYLGAGSPEGAIRVVRLCWKMAAILMGLIGLAFFCWRAELIAWMAPDSGLHQALAAPLLGVCALTQPFFATCIIFKTSMRGAGATRLVMRWSFSSMLLYRVALLWVMSHYGWITLTGVWMALSMDLVTQAILFTYLHYKGKWLDAVV